MRHQEDVGINITAKWDVRIRLPFLQKKANTMCIFVSQKLEGVLL